MQTEHGTIGHQSNHLSAILGQYNTQLRFWIIQNLVKKGGIQFCLVIVKRAVRPDLGAYDIGVLYARDPQMKF